MAASTQSRPAADRGTGSADRPIRLLVVDDSAVARAILTRTISLHPQFEVVAAVAGVDPALAFLATNQVDTILLDIEMPGVDGLTALPQILEASAGAHVLIVASSAADGAAATMRALTLGATDTLAKPGVGASASRFAETLVDRLLKIGHAAGPRHAAAPSPSTQPPPALRPLGTAPVACLAIGASTGGLRALSDLFRALPASFRAPILITQHLPAVFMPFFAAQIEEIAGRPTRVAAEGEALKPGTILVAPGEGHLCVRRAGSEVRVVIERQRVSSGCLPSVDPMLRTVGETFESGAVGVVLTGMGRDGSEAAPGFVAQGGDLIVQDRESSVVWGMPGSIAGAGHAAAVLRPRQIAELLGRRGSAA
ncbi:two-component system chemotaxis response regulator CheB [Sphingomonas jejuensis]|uniref:protein-glutamate methylesterase n=1 Tax=Sphingomonas jejuensis TaxID=904715 RepID=A0ABX0XLS9_9SPHN|nr:chemotaxis-specific protein-glutamate methyltransferase CheB [Sphingomonas jejuensis]NJC33666.1 two-component system chemotaxis response regulator CheB [Sphingomonas jejuensis]